jgi:aspartate kinase
MIKAIAFRRNITVINITSNRMLGAYGFLAKVFDVFLKNETSVDLVTTSEVSISLSIDNVKNLERIKDELSEFANIDILKERAIISVVGEGIRDTSGIASRFFGAISGINISMISMGASEVNLSIIVLEDELEKAVRLLHQEFFENDILPDLFINLNRN